MMCHWPGVPAVVEPYFWDRAVNFIALFCVMTDAGITRCDRFLSLDHGADEDDFASDPSRYRGCGNQRSVYLGTKILRQSDSANAIISCTTTLLYNFDLPAISRYLRMPEKQPEYRQGRSHLEFVGNLPTTADTLKELLAGGWSASGELPLPMLRMEELLQQKYLLDSWYLRRYRAVS